MRPTSLAALALIAPLAAAAQTSPATSETNSQLHMVLNTGSQNYGLSSCQNNTSSNFSVTYDSPVPTGATLTVFLQADQSATCATTVPSNATLYENGVALTESSRSFSFDVSATTLTGTTSTACPTGQNFTHLLCGVVTVSSTSTTTSTVSLSLNYVSQPPATPTLVSADSGDSVMHLHWTWTGSTTTFDHVNAHYRQLTPGESAGVDLCNPPAPESFDAGVTDAGSADAGEVDAGTADAGTDGGTDAGTPQFDATQFQTQTIPSVSGGTVTGLQNGATYQFYVEAVDTFGNISGQSNALYGTPEIVHDFYRRYRCEGGTDTGGFGCATAGAAAVLPACAALGVAVLRRRRRHP